MFVQTVQLEQEVRTPEIKKDQFHEINPVAAVRLTNILATTGKAVTAHRISGVWINLLFTMN